MSLLLNLVLFVVVFLPGVALASMVLTGVLGDRVATSPDWDVGWNPILWLILTTPWVLPTIAAVPILHYVGRSLARRFSRRRARGYLLILSPVLFALGVLALWGPSNFRLEFVLPVAVAGLLYGSLQRVPEGTATGRQSS